MHRKGHNARSKDIILHVGVPSRPQPLKDIEMHIVPGDIVKLAPVGIFRSEQEGRGRVPLEKSVKRGLRVDERLT